MSDTPNVVIESPGVRRALNAVLSYGTLAVGLVTAIDAASPAFDLSGYTLPAMAGLGFLLSALTAGVTIPNIPASPPPRLALGEDDVSGHELGDWPPADPSIEGTEGLPPEGDDHARQ